MFQSYFINSKSGTTSPATAKTINSHRKIQLRTSIEGVRDMPNLNSNLINLINPAPAAGSHRSRWARDPECAENQNHRAYKIAHRSGKSAYSSAPSEK